MNFTTGLIFFILPKNGNCKEMSVCLQNAESCLESFSFGNSAFWKQTENISYDLEDLKAISNIGDFQIGKLKIFVSGTDKNYNYIRRRCYKGCVNIE